MTSVDDEESGLQRNPQIDYTSLDWICVLERQAAVARSKVLTL